MQTKDKKVQFLVTIQYSTEEGASICEQAAKENLFSAIENERQNGALTPGDISADWINVDLQS